MFDPWTAGVDAVVAAQVAAQNAAISAEAVSDLADFCSWRRSPLQQWRVAQRLLEDRHRIEGAGDRAAVLWAVDACLRHGLVVPEWIAKDFSDRLDAISMVWATSWDDDRAFGRPFPKGAHRDALQRRYELADRVYQMVFLARSEDDRAIDKGLFEEVGAVFGIGATYAEDLYRSRLAWWRGRDSPAADKAYDEARAQLRAKGAWPSWSE